MRHIPLLRPLGWLALGWHDLMRCPLPGLLHGLALVYILRDLPGVQQFKIVQESLQRTRILLVAGPAFTPQHQAQVVQQVRARLGTAVQVDIEPVAEIKPEASGKYRYIVSRVALPAKEPCHA